MTITKSEISTHVEEGAWIVRDLSSGKASEISSILEYANLKFSGLSQTFQILYKIEYSYKTIKRVFSSNYFLIT